MKKRLLALTLTLALCLALAAPALAVGYQDEYCRIDMIGSTGRKKVVMEEFFYQGYTDLYLIGDEGGATVDAEILKQHPMIEYSLYSEQRWDPAEGRFVELDNQRSGAGTSTYGPYTEPNDRYTLWIYAYGYQNIVVTYESAYKNLLAAGAFKEVDESIPTAYPSPEYVSVDGSLMLFQFYALKDANGNNTNYIKLRDVASVLSGTAAQFNVGWDGTVNIETGKGYTPNGSEMSTPFSGARTYENATAATNINGEAAALDAIVLKDDNGGAYTYYKLRDLGEALGFNVGWSGDRGVFLETDKPYDANN